MNNTFNIAAFILLVIINLTLTNCKSNSINSPQEGGAIEGKVSNSFTDQGLANAFIELEGGYFQLPDTTTDENGSYNFHNVSQGIYTIITTKYGYEVGKDTFTVYPGNTTKANIALDPGELIGIWSATDIYIPQLNQNYLLSELGLEIEITFDENGEYRGITADSLSSNVNEGNWYTSDGDLIILDPEIGEHKGQYIMEENGLKLKDWDVDYQGVVISVDINFIKQ